MSGQKMQAVFIGGADRSGTTFFGSLLGAHSRCIVTPESQFNTELCRKYETQPWNPAEARGVLKRHERFRIWELEIPEDFGEVSRSWPEMMLTLVDLYGRRELDKVVPEERIWIDHTPSNLDRMELLRRHYPGAKFLHIVRDGRALAASHRRVWWGQDDPLKMAAFWHRKLACAFANECRFPGEAMTVRYEDLVERTEETLARVTEFLGIGFETQMLAGDGLKVPEYTRHQHALVGRPADPTRIASWRRQLSSREIEIFEAEAGEMLEILGYERLYENPRPVTKAEKLGFQLRYRLKRTRRKLRRQLEKAGIG